MDRCAPSARSSSWNTLAAVLAVLAGLALGGCGAHRLSDAQGAFSKGAELENNLARLDAPAAAAYASPFGFYQQADAILTQDTKSRQGELNSDNLLATAYALHAQTLWRLADLSAVAPAGTPAAQVPSMATPPKNLSDAYRTRANEARESALAMKDQLGPRDQLMMAILPDLMDHDTGMQLLAAQQWRRAHDFFRSAYEGIDQALKTVPPNHDVRAYARMAQMQTLVGWHSAIENGLTDSTARFHCYNQWIVQNTKPAVNDLDQIAKERGVRDTDFVNSRLERLGFKRDFKLFGDGKLDCPWN
jgi:hypothetical protein